MLLGERMPPRVTFSKDDVVNAAFEIIKISGFRDLSARKIADRLGSSTAPVYSSFESMESLKKEVILKAEKIIRSYLLEPYTKSVFLNMGTGVILFAMENKELFRVMFLDNNISAEFLKDFMDSLTRELDRDELVSLLPHEDRKEILRRMGIFSHGYASLICSGIISQVTKKDIISTMYNMGRDVIGSALLKNGIKQDKINDSKENRHAD